MNYLIKIVTRHDRVKNDINAFLLCYLSDLIREINFFLIINYMICTDTIINVMLFLTYFKMAAAFEPLHVAITLQL